MVVKLSLQKVKTQKQTIMLVDIAGYTTITRNISQKHFEELHDYFDNIVISAVKANKGLIIKKMGDAFLVTFNTANAAMQCSIELQDSFKLFNVEEQVPYALEVKIALHTGEVLHKKKDIYGDTVNTTARIEKVVKRNQIVFSGATFLELDTGKYPFEDLGQHEFKGLALPVTLFRLRTRQEIEKINAFPQTIPKKITYKSLLSQHKKIVKNLQYNSGIFASKFKQKQIRLGRSWLRDNFYTCLSFSVMGDWETIEKTYSAIIKLFLQHEDKIKKTIAKKQESKPEYITINFKPKHFDVFWDEWGNNQHDTIGSILFMVSKLEQHKPHSILKNYHHVDIINLLIRYLDSIQYWSSKDKGFWSETQELHASSIGACVAGLKEINKLPQFTVPKVLISKGETALRKLFPRESKKKFVDLALLSLIYPYDILTPEEEKQVLKNIQYHLIKNRGIVRYKNDHYFNKNPDKESEEAEWLVGLAWLAVIMEKKNRVGLSEHLVSKVIKNLSPQGIPEVYFSNSKRHNDITPGWAESLFLVALYTLNNVEKKKDPLAFLIRKKKR